MVRARAWKCAIAGALVAGAVVVGVGPAPAVQASNITYVVNSTLDEPHDPAFPGQCRSTPSGVCTLRAALEAGPPAPVTSSDVVTVALTNVLGQTISLDGPITFGELGEWGGSVTISATLDRNRRVSVVRSSSGRLLDYVGAGTLNLTGLSLRDGRELTGSGGALRVEDAQRVELWNTEFRDNLAAVDGGAAAITTQQLLISDSTFVNNTATGDGGALDVSQVGPDGSAVIERTDFVQNSTGGAGGALRQLKDDIFPTIVVGSLFDANTAGDWGGGIACSGCDDDGAGVFLNRSAFVANRALNGDGGGVSASWVGATNTTFTDNAAATASALSTAGGELVHTTIAGNSFGSGGTVVSVDAGAELFVRSSILLDPCSGTITSPTLSTSIVEDDVCLVGGGTADPVAPVDLGPPVRAGGSLTGSGHEIPVLAPVSPRGAPCVSAEDARGAPRPPASPSNPCAFGAYQPDAVGPNASLVVNAVNDAEDRYPGDGVCDTWNGGCTLRAAVMESQALPSADTIDIAAGVGPITLTTPHCNPLTDLNGRCADLDISRGDVTIRGDADRTTISATVGRIFDLSTNVTLIDLDLAGAPGGGEAGGGGLVRVTAPAGKQVTIGDSELHGGGNTFGVGGGAIAFEGEGTLDLHNLFLHDNGDPFGGGVGGAIAVNSNAGVVSMVGIRAEGNRAQFRSAFSIRTRGQVSLTDVVVTGNSGGGAIECTCANALFESVSISGNSGLQTGGLIIAPVPDTWVAPEGVRLENVNISSNSGRGGALVISGATPGTIPVPVALRYVTVANNDGRNGSGFLGGGLVNNNLDPATRPTVTASVLANNLSDDPATSNCRGQITNLGSVFDPLNGCGATGVDTRDPLLGPTTERTHTESDHTLLGPVPVVEPSPSSPVVSSVECSPDVVADVSGVARPTGGGCDAGAVEVVGITLRLFPSASSVTAAGSTVSLAALSPQAVAGPELTIAGQKLAGPTVDGQDLRSADLQESPLGSIPLGSIPLGSIPLGSIPLGSIPLGSIPLNKAGGWTAVLAGTDLADVPLQQLTLQDVVTLDPPVLGTEGPGAITLADLDLTSTPLGSIPLGSIALANLPLGSIPLGSIGGAPLDWCRDIITPAGVPCGTGPGQVNPADPNTTLLALSLAGVPLGSIPLGSIPLGSIDLSGTPLGSIPLGSIDLDASPLGSIPLGSIPLGSIPLGSIPLGSIPLGSIPLGSIPLGSIPLGSIPLGSIPLGSIPLGSIPLGSIATSSSPLGSIPLGSIPMDGTPLGSIPLGSIDLQNSPLGSIPLGSIPLGSIPLGSIPLGSIPLGSIPLGSIPLGSIPLGSIPLVVDCTVVDCQDDDLTLQAIAAAGGLVEGATLAQLGTYGTTTLVHLRAFATALAGTPLGSIGTFGDTLLSDLFGDQLAGPAVRGLLLSQLGAYGDASVAVLEGLDLNGDGVPDGPTVAGSGVGTFADLFPDRAGDWPELDAAVANLTLAQFLALLPPDVRAQFTLGELLQGVVPPAEYPWEDLDLEAAGDVLADESGGLVTFVLEVESALTDSSNFTVDLQLPDGFRYVPGSLTYPGAIVSATGTGSTVSAVVEPRNGTSLLQLQARAPVTVGFRGRSAATLTTTVGGNQIVATATGVDQVVAEAFEPNDTLATATTIAPGSLYLTHLASTGDVDWFKVRASTDGARLQTIVSNLAADFDLAVFGPTDPSLRGAPIDSVVPAADQGRSLLKQGAVAETQVADDIDLTAPAGYELLGVSAQRGTGDEQVETVGLVRNTDYYVRITGYQGALSAQPYALRVKFTTPSLIDGCTATTLPAASGPAATFPAIPANATTLYVVHSGRMRGFYAGRGLEVDGDAVLSSLQTLVTAVNGAPAARFGGEVAGVLDLATLPAVRAAYATWDSDPCRPNLANGVVNAIGAALDTVLASRSDIANIVIVGNDDQIPFARVRDATVYSNEREYVEGPGVRQTPLTNSLALGYLLTDDPYADATPLGVGSRELFVPDLAIGRLVEMPAEIKVALDNYVRFDGRLDPQTALSTGYDFLDDGAEEIAKALRDNELGPNGDGLTTAELRGDAWDSAALDEQLTGTATVPAPDIASVNAHFDHFRALPAASDAADAETDLYTTDDVLDEATRPTLERSLLFSMGCHGGLSVSDLTVGGIRTNDWAQSFAGAGAVFAGNTGFGYGDTAIVAATEDLMLRFAGNLDGTMTVGQAMSLAKQRYISATRVGMTPFDEKVVAQVVMYGMPQYRIGGVTPEEPTFVTPTPDTTGLGLDTFPVTLGNEFELVTGENGRGQYWTFGGDSQATAGQPVQPRAVIDVTAAQREARGALITSLTSTDSTLADPVYTTPAVDSAATSPEVSTTPTIFPTRLQSVSRYETPAGPRDELVVIPGQFSGGGAGTGGGRQRRFTSLGASVLYAPTSGVGAGDTREPVIGQVTAVLGAGGGVTFEVAVTDNTDVARATVLFIPSGTTGAWTSVRLTRDGDVWRGSNTTLAAGTEIDFIVQAADVGGNVAMSTNKGDYFEAVEVGPPSIDVAGPFNAQEGWYTGPVDVTVAPFTTGAPVDVTVNGERAGTALRLDQDGVYEIEATTPAGPTTSAVVRVDRTGPEIRASASPSLRPSTVPVDVTLVGEDTGIGVESIRYRTSGAVSTPETVVDAGTATVTIGETGVTKVTAVAVDGLGRRSAEIEIEVEVAAVVSDVTPPTVTCASAPTTWQRVDVVISCTATDDSGLAPDSPASFQLRTSVPDGTESATAMTDSRTICDTFNHCTTVGPFQAKVDKKGPTVSVNYPRPGEQVILRAPVSTDSVCTDAGSGMASCASVTLSTSTLGAKTVTVTGRDVAGNVTTVTVPYSVVHLWNGYQLPILDPPLINLNLTNRTVPVRFSISDASRRIDRDLPHVTRIEYRRYIADGTLGPAVVLVDATRRTGLSSALLGYRYDWKTPNLLGAYRFTVTLDDGTSHHANFILL